jgi:hypothetical protein
MTATLEQFFDEPITAPIAPKPAKANREIPPAKATTDIHLWLKSNCPRDLPDVTALRQSLYQRRSHGGYIVEVVSDERFKVTGRTSTLLIVSDKARHYLLRQLCKLLGSDRIRDCYARKTRHFTGPLN